MVHGFTHVNFKYSIAYCYIFESLRDKNRPHPKNCIVRKGAGAYLAQREPTGVKLGPTSPTAHILNPNGRAQIEAAVCDAHGGPSHVQGGATWDLLATASHQVGVQRKHNMGNVAQHEVSSMPKKHGKHSENRC